MIQKIINIIWLRQTILITGIISLTLTSLMIWVSDKGLDITDESYYFIGYYFNIESVLPFSFFHKIHNVFLGYNNLIWVRLSRLLLTLISSIFLGYTASLFFNFKHKFEAIIFIIIFSFLGFSSYPYASSYNTFSIIFINLIFGLTLIYRSNKTIPFLLGFLITLQFLNKFSTLLAIFIFMLISYFLRFNGQKKIKNTGQNMLHFFLFLIGIAVAYLILFNSEKDFIQPYQNLIKGLFTLKSHPISTTFTSLYYGFIHILSYCKFYILSAFLITVFINKTRWKNKNQYIIYGLLAIYALLLFRIKLITTPIGFFIPYFLILTIILIFYLFNKKEFKKRDLIYALLFITMPFLISLGTSNSLLAHFIFGGNILGLGIYLLIEKLPKNFKTGIIWLLSLTVFIQVSHNVIYKPFRLNNSILEQTFKITDSPALNDIKVDSVLYNLTKELSFLQNHPSKRVFLFPRQFGISLIIDKSPYPFYWIEEKDFSNLDQVLIHSKRINPENLILIFPSTININKSIENAFSAVKINFPRNYEIIKTIIYNDDTLNIYSHSMNTKKNESPLLFE